eukprot:1722076-Amphidinium_carterae.1
MDRTVSMCHIDWWSAFHQQHIVSGNECFRLEHWSLAIERLMRLPILEPTGRLVRFRHYGVRSGS